MCHTACDLIRKLPCGPQLVITTSPVLVIALSIYGGEDASQCDAANMGSPGCYDLHFLIIFDSQWGPLWLRGQEAERTWDAHIDAQTKRKNGKGLRTS